MIRPLSRDRFGRISEYIAIIYLSLKFYTILKLRYKHRVGEIDIVARKGDVLVFVEVKSRKKLNTNYEIISHRQISRIKRAASFYLQQNMIYNNECDVRFDLIIISGFWHIEHMKNVW